VRANNVQHTGPQTLTQAVVEAMVAWVAAQGAPLDPAAAAAALTPPTMGRPPLAEEAKVPKRPVGRPPKPPYQLPEGSDGVELWNEFWRRAYAQDYLTAVHWVERTYSPDFFAWHAAVFAAMPEDIRAARRAAYPTREEVGLPSQAESDAALHAELLDGLGKKGAT
jgi:hypothetical protein